MKASLCVLARGNPEQTVLLINSVEAFRGLDVEVVIGDNSPSEKDRAVYKQLSDVYFQLDDRFLWDRGFGPAKQKVVDAATYNWVIVADVGEVWHDNTVSGAGLAKEIELNPQIPVFRVLRGPTAKVQAVAAGQVPYQYVLNDDNGRIFDRRQVAIYGMIHEAPFHKQTGVIWAHWARRLGPLAFVEHGTGEAPDDDYESRKNALYDHLVHTIVHNPHLREGTDRYWWTTHWDEVVQPRYKKVTFEEWQKLPG